ncbi:hypothetical protein [Serratia marcescens]|uniref:hypothetical protein n=1 Tax=Serratia marcescens TaxID=615 RepID=UPI0006ED1638|nr:hypothetical protein [Serratia marcescens]ALL35898.1 hypothetical protein AR325_02495 [Serratia marcescens]PHI50879.1 hypothetical protein B9T65_13800 [Serratia marcescens]UJA54444.1 hypothetical protein L1F17_00455 [Serratia marcescens]HDU7919558.1 hypothetical protein [Serratia marcescens]
MSHSSLPITAALMGILLVSGCQSTKMPQIKTASASTLQDEKIKRETQDLKQCQQNLNALGTLKTADYPAKKQVFDNLMSGASQYAGLRTQVNERTQETVDALYRYQVSYQCAKINQALLTELAKRGGAIK